MPVRVRIAAWLWRENNLPEPEQQLAEIGSPVPRVALPLAVVTLIGWAGLTLVELVIRLQGWISLGLTVLQTLAVPALTVALLGLARQELEDEDPKARRRQGLLAFAVHGGVLLLLSGALVGKYQLIFQVIEDATSVAALQSSYETYTLAVFILAVVAMLGSPRRIAGMVASAADQPARLMAGSFGLAALIGTLVLALPVSLNHVEDASLLDALFNSVSAVCVTGLAVGNVAETYSFFGQIVLFVLFQMGGLGIMSLSTFFAVLAGRRLQARRAKAMAELLDVDSFAMLRRSLVGIVAVTFVVEALGAGGLYLALGAYPDVALTAMESESASAGPGSRLWAAVFHSVSAYCNAGFSNFRDGMYPFVGAHAVSGLIVVLIVIGGIGFPVVFELLQRFGQVLRRQRRKRMSLHTRVVLVTSVVLWGLGVAAFLFIEHGTAFAHLGWVDRVGAAIFQSVTLRTAGFSTVDFGTMTPATWMVAAALMFIGASPGSTGGGTKTTTLAVLFATLRAELRSGDQPTLSGRSLTNGTVRRAIAVTFINVIVVGAILFVLLITESHDPARIAFEAVSATSTAGLSTGITSDLSSMGKLVVALGMFLGRIGPLTAALAVADTQAKPRYRYVEERIAIG